MPYLEHYPQDGGTSRRIPLTPLPFRIGRSSVCEFVIMSNEVSKEHAEIFRVGDEYRIRDLGSTNGTFINGSRIIEAPLADDDCFHLGDEELRFRASLGEAVSDSGPQTVLVTRKRRAARGDAGTEASQAS